MKKTANELLSEIVETSIKEYPQVTDSVSNGFKSLLNGKNLTEKEQNEIIKEITYSLTMLGAISSSVFIMKSMTRK